MPFTGESQHYMQGTLNEIDIRSILQLIELGQRTGALLIESVSGQSWFLFFAAGKVVYDAVSAEGLNRLQDYLRHWEIEADLDPVQAQTVAATNIVEYGCLWQLLEQQTLTPAQGRQMIRAMVRETVFDLLSLHQGSFKFELAPALSPQLVLLDIAPLVREIITQVQEWKSFYPHIQSPEQCLEMTQPTQAQELLPASIFKRLKSWSDGQTSIRRLARVLDRDLVAIARMIYPYVQQGVIQLIHPQGMNLKPESALLLPTSESRDVPRIVCVDDSVAIGKAVEGILSQNGYEVSAIANPLKALSLVFQLKPDLLLCDIAMPELDGYELCMMLRSTSVFRHTPIIMLTGRDSFIDRARARIAGATNYLTKPFVDQELLMLVESYVGPGDPNRPNPDKLLAEALREELLLESLPPVLTPSASF